MKIMILAIYRQKITSQVTVFGHEIGPQSYSDSKFTHIIWAICRGDTMPKWLFYGKFEIFSKQIDGF